MLDKKSLTKQKKRNQKPVRVFQPGKFFHFVCKTMFSQHYVRVSVLVTVSVWTAWLTLVGPSRALSNLIANWEVATTMVFGSMVAGGTSMGGGAVAFPVLTKGLQISPAEAKLFSLAIQSVGMSAASLTIIIMRGKVEWHFIRWTSLGGVLGLILGSFFLAPVLPPELIKMSFTMIISSFAVVLFVLNRTKRRRNLTISFWGKQEQVFALGVGILGGIISSLVGSGIDILSFSIMVLLFGICEKVSTLTSVILMAINSVAGFLLHKYIIGDFVEPVLNYWLAAVPVVVVGAPIGAMLCSLLKRKAIAKLVIGIVFIEVASSFVLIPLNALLIGYSLLVFTVFLSIYYWMYQSKVYLKDTQIQNKNCHKEAK